MANEWKQIEESAQELLYSNADSSVLYVTDTYKGRLYKTGNRYSLIYAEPLNDVTTLETSDDIDELEAIAEDLVNIEYGLDADLLEKTLVNRRTE